MEHDWGRAAGIAVRLTIILGSAGFLVLYLIILADLLVGEPVELGGLAGGLAGLAGAASVELLPEEASRRWVRKRPSPARVRWIVGRGQLADGRRRGSLPPATPMQALPTTAASSQTSGRA